MKKEICQLHLKNQLTSLSSNKNYLQLGKITSHYLNELLLQYCKIEGKIGEKTINTILENYFNRKGIRPAEYLENVELEPLKLIWEDFHHKIHSRVTPLTQTYPMNCTRTSAFMENVF